MDGIEDRFRLFCGGWPAHTDLIGNEANGQMSGSDKLEKLRRVSRDERVGDCVHD